MYHTADGQVFHCQHVKALHRPMRQLMAKMVPAVPDALMDTCDNTASVRLSRCALRNCTKLALGPLQALLISAQELGTRHVLPRRESDKML